MTLKSSLLAVLTTFSLTGAALAADTISVDRGKGT